jgi:drug/metabolite transporter (DMT)-like permease
VSHHRGLPPDQQFGVLMALAAVFGAGLALTWPSRGPVAVSPNALAWFAVLVGMIWWALHLYINRR